MTFKLDPKSDPRGLPGNTEWQKKSGLVTLLIVICLIEFLI